MPMQVEEILKLAEPWGAPISDGSPSGASAKEDERYLAVTSEIAKLDSPAATIDWKNLWSTVITRGCELLQEKSKDFLIATQVAYAMYRQDSLKGLLKGIALLVVLIDNYWLTMFPEVKRIRGRANALQWFVEKTVLQLGAHKVEPGSRDTIDNLVVIVKRLNSSTRDKFGDAAPAIGSLREALERMAMDAGPSQAELDAQAAEAANKAKAEADAKAKAEADAKARADAAPAAPAPVTAPPPVVAAPAPPPPVVAAAPAVTVAAPSAVVAAAPADVSQVSSWLSGVGTTIAQTGATVRRSADSAALAYRMLRVGLYTHVLDAPPADASGKTKVPPPNPNTRKQIETIASNQKWAPLLEETESALVQSRFWLDAHRYTALALAGLGAHHQSALTEVLRELAVVLRRLPTLATLQFSDGTPFADAATRSWIDSEVLAAAGGSGGTAPSGGAAQVVVVQQGGGVGEEVAVVNEARKMAAGGKAAEALAMLHAKATSAPSAAARFRYRLGVGQVCLAAGQPALARGVFEGLERDVVTYNLEAWEPALAAASAEGLVQSYRALAKGGKPIPPEASMLYDRVCRLDPTAALRLGA